MKWMLVVLVGGMTPVNTDLVFDKFAGCLAAEKQMSTTPTPSRSGTDRPRQISSGDANTQRCATSRPNACLAASVRAFLMQAATP